MRIKAKTAWFLRRARRGCPVAADLADLRETGDHLLQDSRQGDPPTWAHSIYPKKWRTTTVVDHADAQPSDLAAASGWNRPIMVELLRRYANTPLPLKVVQYAHSFDPHASNPPALRRPGRVHRIDRRLDPVVIARLVRRTPH